MIKGTVSIEKYQELQAKYAVLQFELEQLKRLIFGAKSERFYGTETAEGQLSLFGQTNNEEASKAQEKVETQTVKEHERKVSKKGTSQKERLILPDHLERKEVVIEPNNLTDDMVKIGEERSEQLVYEPATLFVEVTVRPKYVVPNPKTNEQTDTAEEDFDENTSKIIIAEMPERFIPKSVAHISLLALILVDKFVYHLPLYRTIERIYQLGKVQLPKSTVSNWVGQSAEKLTILYEKLIEIVLQAAYLQVDETRIEVLPNSPPPTDEQKRRKKTRVKKPKKRKTERGWLWCYFAPQTKLTVFDYDPSRGANNPARRLKKYNGTVQSDGLEVYELIAKAYPNIVHYQCLVHGRRKFEAALSNDAKRAEQALLVFQKIYAIERQAKENNLTDEELFKLRQEKSRPLLEDLFNWLEAEQYKVLPKEPIGKAIAYMLNRKAGLLHYLTDAQLLPDTNLVENAIRPVAVGRKNYLFAGSHDAAQWAAIFYSFFACCKANNINPYEWLVDVMQRLNTTSIQNLEELLPHKWVKGNGVR